MALSPDVVRYAELYHAAVSEGFLPLGRPAGVGRQTARTEAGRRGGWTRSQMELRCAAALAAGLLATEDDSPRRMALRGEVGGPPIPEIAKPPEGFIVTRNSGAYDGDGNLLRQWVGSKPDAGEIYDVPAGHVIKGESALLTPDGRVMAKWVKTREGGGEGLIEALQEAFAAYEGAAPTIPEPDQSEPDTLTVYPIPDLHLGMFSWGEETGADYDLKIATQIASDSVSALVRQSRPSLHGVVMILGDWFHQNDQKNATPGSGHQLDVDGRWPKVYLAGCNLAISLVDRVARKHENVEVVITPGNHDSDAAVTLSVALALFYSNNPRITVSLKPGVTWYRRFGACLLGATHGHTVKPERAAMAMAVDRHEDWGKSRHRHVFMGHIHTETAKEIAGVRVETFNSPAARDAWNAASGYRSGRSLSAITFHCEDGEIGRHRVNIAPGRSNVGVAA